MPKTTTKTAIKLRVDIRPGPASVSVKQAWKRFWQRLIATVGDK